jgi:hypothetical protein
MDPQNLNATDLQQWAEALRKARSEMEQFGVVSAGTAAELEKLQKQAQFNEMWAKKWSMAAGAATGAALSLGSALYKGQTGASAAAGAFSELTTSLGDAITTLSLLSPMGWIKKGLMFLGGQALKLLGNAAKETARVSDEFYDSMYRLSNVGMMSAGGMERFAGNLLNLGYGLEEIDKAIDLLKNNAEGLAQFGGTANQGAQRLGEFTAELRTTETETNKQLRRLFKDADGVNKRFAVYASQQSQLGLQSQVTLRGFKEMAMATDSLTKAFGITTEQLDEQIKQQRMDTAMRVLQQKLVRERGQEGANQYAEIERQVSAIATRYGPEIANALKAVITQQTGTPEFAKAFNTLKRAGVDATKVQQRLFSGQQDVFDLAEDIGKGTLQVTKDFEQLGLRSKDLIDNNFVSVAAGLDLNAKKLRDSYEKAKIETDAQTQSIGKSGEKQLEMRQTNELTRNTLQSFIEDGIQPATYWLNKLAGAAQAVVGERESGFTEETSLTNKEGPNVFKGGVFGKLESFITRGEGFRGGPYGKYPKAQEADASQLMGAAAKNLNPGNIKFANQAGATLGTGGFAKFESVDQGIVALVNQLDLYLSGRSTHGKLDTIRSLVSKYAPPNENKTQEYVDQLSQFMGKTPDDKLQRNPATLAKLAAGIIGKESMNGLEKGYNFRNSINAAVSKIFSIDPSDIGQYKKGGISDGPSSGYLAMLHGLEAIVPLANNRSIPVSFRDTGQANFSTDMAFGQDFVNINESLTKQSQVLEQQLQKSEAMIQALNRFASSDQMTVMIDKLQNISDKMNTSNDISSRILQVQM